MVAGPQEIMTGPEFINLLDQSSSGNMMQEPEKRKNSLLHRGCLMAERVGFEPTVPERYTAFRVQLVMTTSISLLKRFLYSLTLLMISVKNGFSHFLNTMAGAMKRSGL